MQCFFLRPLVHLFLLFKKFLSSILFLALFGSIVKNTRGEKVGVLSKRVAKNYVDWKETFPANPQPPPPVEKPVDNVEKSMFSTGISPFIHRVYCSAQPQFSNFFVEHNATILMLRKQKSQRIFPLFFPKKLDILKTMSTPHPLPFLHLS